MVEGWQLEWPGSVKVVARHNLGEGDERPRESE